MQKEKKIPEKNIKYYTNHLLLVFLDLDTLKIGIFEAMNFRV